MKKLSKEKRNQVILSCVLVLAFLGGLSSFLIRFQKSGIADLQKKKLASEAKLGRIREIINNSQQIEREYLIVSNRLAALEGSMASGDLYATMVTAIRSFKQDYDIEIPQMLSRGTEVPLDIMPRFPYKQVTLTIHGSANYSDLGKFIAAFENRFPASRILNLEISPSSAQNAGDQEKLAFKMDLVSLVKPVPTPNKPL